jgi:hypothetical protein
MKKAIICILTLAASTAMATDQSPYAFGGSCSSQGAWTANALSSTQELRRITNALHDDPNCKALGKGMQTALTNLEAEVQKANAELPAENTRRLSQIPNEIAALRSYYGSTKEDKVRTKITGMLMKRSLEGASLSAAIEGASPNARTAVFLRELGQRADEASKTGLKLFNQVVDTLPQLETCINDKDTQLMGNVMSGLVQVATSFASSGADTTGSQVAQTVAKLTTYMRDSKFSSVFRTLNQTEFQASMACLVEITSEAYCNARDAMGLFKSGMTDLNWRKQQGNKVTSGNPFVGYYVLNTHIPNITRWMQKIQIGVDPMLPTDAVFQNRIQQEVTDFYMGLKTLLGEYNATTSTIRSLQNVKAKKQQLLKLIQSITEAMLRGGATSFGGQGDKTNFFTMASSPLEIPFLLLGMQVPEQIWGRDKGLQQIDYFSWLQANMDSLPEFQNPEALAEKIGTNMRQLAQSANVNVIEYFSKWYIVDKEALMNESTVDVNYTVRESLLITRQYLEVAKERLIKYNGDYSRLPMIMLTQKKIDAILEKYAAVEATGKAFKVKLNAANLTEDDVLTASKEAADLIQTVYEQFNVMLSRSGFLANRMIGIIQYDYTLLIQNKVNFSDYQNEIFVATGMAGLDRMLQMFNANPANIQSDLNMALDINKGNLFALEKLLKDNFVAVIAKKKMVAEDRNGFGAITRDSIGRLLVDVSKDKYSPVTNSKKDRGSWWNPWNFAPELTSPAGYFTVVGYWWANANRYPLGDETNRAPESEFKDNLALFSQFCIQSLAFYDQSAISTMCKEAILRSPFGGLKSLDLRYEQRYNAYRDDKRYEPALRKAWNYSDRICAFRDYNRKNLVKFMSLNKKEKQEFFADQAAKQGGQAVPPPAAE